MNLQNYEAAITDFKMLLDINPGNKVAREQIAVATQRIQDAKRQEKDIYTKMFQKQPKREVLKVWKDATASKEATEEKNEVTGIDSTLPSDPDQSNTNHRDESSMLVSGEKTSADSENGENGNDGIKEMTTDY
jgi:hypothetical protein